MGFLWISISAAALGGAVFSQDQEDGFSRAIFTRAFIILWLSALASRFAYCTIIYPHVFSPLRHLPTAPGGHWLLGHLKQVIQSAPGSAMKEWMSTVPNDGLIRYFWLFNRERLLVTSPEALAEVLVTHVYAFKKPENVVSSLGRTLGFGIVLAEGEEHKRQRRNLSPAFAFRHIKNLYPVFWEKAVEAGQAMMADCGARGFTELEVGGWASRVTLDIIGVAGLGRDFHAVRDGDSELVRTYDLIFTPTRLGRVLALLGTVVPGWVINALPLSRNRELERASETIRGMCRELIGEKKKRRAAQAEQGVDILSVALESGQFSDENLVDQLMTFLAAGHETTTRAATWAVYALCRHPEVQERLRGEIRERLPWASRGGGGITSSDIDGMPYLNAVCSEVLRCYSPIPLTIREAAVDTTIRGCAVRKGVRVMLVPWATNVSTEMWGPDAAEFDPERWMVRGGDGRGEASLEEKLRAANGGAASHYAFLTFLHGPRSCMGASFARAELACLVAAWVGRFEFELVDRELMDETRLEVRLEVTAKPARGLKVRARVVE